MSVSLRNGVIGRSWACRVGIGAGELGGGWSSFVCIESVLVLSIPNALLMVCSTVFRGRKLRGLEVSSRGYRRIAKDGIEVCLRDVVIRAVVNMRMLSRGGHGGRCREKENRKDHVSTCGINSLRHSKCPSLYLV
ncbi:hypothetical protein E4T47_04219 [Aureobasidium subglaciale]|nr:hypothetical protein E4T47_04219 [Aureobasidium subglaciale]